jgi:hypothetical protein
VEVAQVPVDAADPEDAVSDGDRSHDALSSDVRGSGCR